MSELRALDSTFLASENVASLPYLMHPRNYLTECCCLYEAEKPSAKSQDCCSLRTFSDRMETMG